jgi:hypothetical protein
LWPFVRGVLAEGACNERIYPHLILRVHRLKKSNQQLADGRVGNTWFIIGFRRILPLQ